MFNEIYGVVRKKILKIRKSLSNARIAIFEPVTYLNEYNLKKQFKVYEKSLGHRPKSYTEIEDFARRKWKEEDNLDVEFWNENHLK